MTWGPMNLRLLTDKPMPTPDDECRAIEMAFANSPFPLLARPDPHPRGGFSVEIDAAADRWDDIAQLLQAHQLLAVI